MTATTGLASSTSEESQETTIPLRGSFAGDVGRRRGSGCADDEVSGLTEEEAARAGFGCRCPCSPGARRVHDCDLLGRAHVELDVRLVRTERVARLDPTFLLSVVADILLSRKPAPIGLVPVCSAVSASQVANPISQSSTPPMWFFNFNRNGPSGFSGASTAEEVTAGVDARGLAAVVTGASSGIGLETTRVLALRGVRVVMAVRNVAAGHKAREAIRAEIHGAIVHVLEMDLSSMDSVRRFASEFDSLNLPLNILINNAGILSKDCIRSIDGLELHFATNHIGHFLLTNLLLENMKSTRRIINVSSSGHILTYPEGICFDSVKDLSRFSTYIAYGQSKLANILHSTELARILKGAATTCYVALHPQVTGISGKYFSNCNLETPSSQASNAELAKKLWEFSSNIVSAAKLTTRTVSGLSFPAMPMATTKGARDGREGSRRWNLEVHGTVDGEAIGRTEEEARRCAGLRLQSAIWCRS
uniref:Short-chain dehydrogenase TIC 32, chloroplastic n=1 Tax=Oryza rufipogon TaxID=4529 RepID=A0A0E0R246_ORYRU